MLISIEALREFLDYDPLTGLFAAKRGRKGFMRKIGEWFPASFICDRGYCYITLNGRRYLAHRLAWAITHGFWPPKDIDHIDGNPSNNKLANLREATRQENLRNQRLKSTNTSGHKGVGWHKSSGKWRAYACLNGKQVCLGNYPTIEEAVAARRRGAQELYGKFHREN